MAGSCWRLLVFLLWIFCSLVLFSEIVFSPIVGGAVLFAQEIEPSPARGHVVGPNLAEEPLPAGDRARSESSPSAPFKIPPPVLPRRYPVAPANPGLPLDVFQQLVRSAGMIFSGRVTSVGNAASSPGNEHTATAITITFQVERAMRGILPNQIVTIREWAGLRNRGERYRVGERVLLFLYGPSKLGLTSPVAGPMGRFALDSQDRIVMSAAHMAGFAGNPILRGKPIVSYVDFAQAVRNAQPDEWIQP
jgi:hypothetical protein